MSEQKEQVEVTHRDAWRAWLSENHMRIEGVWLVRYKKHCGDKYVTYDAAVEEALCFGWIDSLPRRLDDDRTMLWMAPRKVGSGWSRVNKTRVETMIAAGLMHPVGMAKIDAAKADGSWAALDAIENLEIPADLAAAFDQYPSSANYFDAFPRSVKRGILEWILNAKRPQTRAKRIDETARLAAENKRANQWRK